MSDHKRIYLSPDFGPYAERCWCSKDDPEDYHDENGKLVPWTPYVRADLYDAAIARAEKAEAERDRLRKALEPFANPHEDCAICLVNLLGDDACKALNSLATPKKEAAE